MNSLHFLTAEQAARLAKDVIEYRDSKGFVPAIWNDLPTRLCCITAEIDELVDALSLDGAGSVTVRHELADIAMYALTILSDLNTLGWCMRGSYACGSAFFCRPEEMVKPLRRHVTEAFEAWRRNNRAGVFINLELLLAALADLRSRVLRLDGDIASDVRGKILYAKNRPPTHGGKDPRS